MGGQFDWEGRIPARFEWGWGMNSSRTEVTEKVRDNQDILEALAASDLRCSKYAEELLALAEDNGDGY
ncbi:hypothetical protein [Halobaculum rarum]|uniref:hypothetical protein n=1 Tax=Halobaculum rarum TaxID=3075122 RepID=UPI0032AEA453